MLEKITNQIFVEKKMKKMLKISKISFFLGIVAVIAFPLFSKNIKIEEKHLRNTSLYSRKIDNIKFSSYFKTYFYEPNYQDDIYNFCTKIFYNTSNIPYNQIFTRNVISPRGRKQHIIQINLIYDKIKNLENTKNTNFVFYALLHYLNDKKNIYWLAKDIQINYVTKELFDENPKECFELLTNGKYNKLLEQGKYISAIYNFDLSEIDLEKLNTFLIKIVGINSEHIDIDFYKMVVSNFQANFNNMDFKITTNEPVLSKNVKDNILNFLNIFNDIIKTYVKNADYKNKYIYIIQDIINDYFFINNKITTNNLLITNHFNSLLIKTIGQSNYNSRDRKIKSCYNLLGTIILMIKGMNTEEIDIFRGLYFYILSSPYQCIEYTYLFILILMTLRGFFHLIELIYHNEYKFIWNRGSDKVKNKEEDITNVIYASRIISGLFFMGIIYIFFMINIEKSIEVMNIQDLVYNYYFMIGNIFVNQIFVLTVLSLSRSEEKFINIILMYLQILNCWNFVFINVGIGLTMTVIFMSMEFIFLHLTLVKHCIIKIGIIGLVLFGLLSWKELINTMVNNYINFNNSVYIMVTIGVILLTLRIALFIVMMMNKFIRHESWNFDEVIDIEEINDDIDNDNNKENNNIKINKEENKDDDNDQEIIEEENKDDDSDKNIEIIKEDNNEKNIELIKEDNEDDNDKNIEIVKEDNKDDSDKNIEIIKEEENIKNIEIIKEDNEDDDNKNIEIVKDDNEDEDEKNIEIVKDDDKDNIYSIEIVKDEINDSDNNEEEKKTEEK